MSDPLQEGFSHCQCDGCQLKNQLRAVTKELAEARIALGEARYELESLKFDWHVHDTIVAERDQLKRDALLRRPSWPCPHEQENNRLRAALEPTSENELAIARNIAIVSGSPHGIVEENDILAAAAAIAAIRAKAGLP